MPMLGQHTQEILQDIGFSRGDCLDLASRGIVGGDIAAPSEHPSVIETAV